MTDTPIMRPICRHGIARSLECDQCRIEITKLAVDSLDSPPIQRSSNLCEHGIGIQLPCVECAKKPKPPPPTLTTDDSAWIREKREQWTRIYAGHALTGLLANPHFQLSTPEGCSKAREIGAAMAAVVFPDP